VDYDPLELNAGRFAVHLKLLGNLALATACIAAIACGGDSSEPDSTTPSGSSKTTPAPSQSQAGPTALPDGSKLPSAPCDLFPPAELQKIAPMVTTGRTATDTASTTPTASCYYEWVDASGTPASLEITVAVIPGGSTLDQVRTSWQTSVRDAKENGAELSGIGDFAVFISPIAADAEGRALVKGLTVSVELMTLGARAKKDQVVSILKSVVGKL